MFHIFRHKNDTSLTPANYRPSASDISVAKAYFDSGSAVAALKANSVETVKLCATGPIEYNTKPIVFTVWLRSFQGDVYGWVLGELTWDTKIPLEEQHPNDARPGYSSDVWLTMLTENGQFVFGQRYSNKNGELDLFDSSNSEFTDWVAAEQAVQRLLP